MEKKYLSAFVLFLSIFSFGQIGLRMANGSLFSNAQSSSAFIDASSNPEYNDSDNLGKGLLFPRVKLTSFSQFGGSAPFSPQNYPSLYDGFLVYNVSEGGTIPPGGGKLKGTLTKGFYYYDNSGSFGSVLNGGTWKKLGSSAITSLEESVTNVTVDDKPVYSFKGSFAADGVSTSVTLNDLNTTIINNISAVYRITIYNKDKSLFTNTVYSFRPETRTIITGAPNMSMVYPGGTYTYILEYVK
ncbi:hypothetical protein DRF59_06555 [Chryseobacterium flavum]|uniref:Uncharacterized protein n=1 Tax=Chryseobacterium flavum TaxID=415851 RepID=A0A3D9CQC8_9FLAO|nr:hypothetical protein [Chryseobacterium flavum]REC67970.1 hypothetical protein DRF59_06555 [Chryseobacterium flavum]